MTGAGGGIGQACARLFAREGAAVVAAERTQAGADKAAGAVGGGRLEPVGFDVTDAAETERAFATAIDRFGGIDILVNCAGVASIVPTVEVEPEEWRRVHAINLDGTFFASRAFVRALAARGAPGAIVILASVAGVLAIPDRPAYIASKHPVVGLTREMAMEFGPSEIRVNAVPPGVIRSPKTEAHFQDPGRTERMARAHPLGRAGAPEEVAEAVAFLCSDAASFVTGAVLAVEGGYSAGKAW